MFICAHNPKANSSSLSPTTPNLESQEIVTIKKIKDKDKKKKKDKKHET